MAFFHEYPTFFTPERLAEFWQYVRWFFAYNMPIAMICLSVFVAYLVGVVVIDVVADARAAQAGRRRKEDDDDD